jgi:hypothetical protein
VRGMPTGPCAAEHRADAVRRMSGRFCDRHAEREWGNKLYSMCCWDVHAGIDVWVSSVHRWVCDELIGCSRRSNMHGVRCRAAQQRVNSTMHSMFCRHVPGLIWANTLLHLRVGRDDELYVRYCYVHSLCTWAVQQCFSDRMYRMSCWLGNRHLDKYRSITVRTVYARTVQYGADRCMYTLPNWAVSEG